MSCEHDFEVAYFDEDCGEYVGFICTKCHVVVSCGVVSPHEIARAGHFMNAPDVVEEWKMRNDLEVTA